MREACEALGDELRCAKAKEAPEHRSSLGRESLHGTEKSCILGLRSETRHGLFTGLVGLCLCLLKTVSASAGA